MTNFLTVLTLVIAVLSTCVGAEMLADGDLWGLGFVVLSVLLVVVGKMFVKLGDSNYA